MSPLRIWFPRWYPMKKNLYLFLVSIFLVLRELCNILQRVRSLLPVRLVRLGIPLAVWLGWRNVPASLPARTVGFLFGEPFIPYFFRFVFVFIKDNFWLHGFSYINSVAPQCDADSFLVWFLSVETLCLPRGDDEGSETLFIPSQ